DGGPGGTRTWLAVISVAPLLVRLHSTWITLVRGHGSQRRRECYREIALAVAIAVVAGGPVGRRLVRSASQLPCESPGHVAAARQTTDRRRLPNPRRSHPSATGRPPGRAPRIRYIARQPIARANPRCLAPCDRQRP